MKNPRAFTLIEMMVAVSIFAIVMLVGVGALLSLVAVNNRAQAINSTMNNLNAALETMARNLRTGTTYHCGTVQQEPLTTLDCWTGASVLAFIDSSGNEVRYQLSGGSLQRSTDKGLSWLQITSPDITIDRFNFYVNGSSNVDFIQPRILIYVHGYAKVPQGTTTFTVQTGVTQRILDVAPSP